MKKHTTLKSKFNSAFSLVELLVVIAVIAVIAAIAIPNLAGIRESATGARAEVTAATLDRLVESAATAKTGDSDNLVFGATNGTVNAATDRAGARAILLTNGVLTAIYTNRAYAADGTLTNIITTNTFSVTGATSAP
jgi:prepilin-type N-terminal cleavage/methylation domain-containing protein